MKKQHRILFLDDDQYEMEGFIERLRHGGFDVVPCTDPNDALERLQTDQDFDVIISDVLMKQTLKEKVEGISQRYVGAAFCEAVRHRLGWKRPIIVLTVVTESEVMSRLSGLASKVLTKPIEPRLLENEVRAALDKSPEAQIS